VTRPPRTTLEHALDLWRQVAHLITPKEHPMHWTAEVLTEMARARAKFPEPELLLTAFTEEAGEVVKAVLDHYSAKGELADVRKELIQVGAMVGRLLEEGDPVHRLPPSDALTRGMDQGGGLS
jgi:Ser/Thr protein kinase RdoA (MazF antagonist)